MQNHRTLTRCACDTQSGSTKVGSVGAGRVSGTITRAVVWGAILLPALGCGGASDVAPVSGSVTLNGQPVAGGFVFVTPEKGKMAKGEIGPDGAFTLGTYSSSDGARVGSHPVTVLPPPTQEWSQPSDGETRVPARYASTQTSELTIEVEAGVDNKVTLSLTTP